MLETAAVVGGGLLARSAATSAAASAAAFSTGVFLQQSLEQVKFPKLRVADDGAPTFKLSIRVLAASVPGLEQPSCGIERPRPFLEATLGSSTKATEFADFSRRNRKDGVPAEDCPWRFSDTLTFTARLEDVFGSGLRLCLRVRKDLLIGPFEITLRSESVAEGGVDFRGRVLPACVEERQHAGGRGNVWGSPMLLVPLYHVQGGGCGASAGLGEAVAHVALAFSIDSDPEAILAAAGCARRESFNQKLAEMEDALKSALDPGIGDVGTKLAKIMEPVDSKAACTRAANRAWSVSSATEKIESPEHNSDGWVCRTGPNGQVYWHHLALGPAPWEPDGSKGDRPSRGPDERPEDWVSHQGPDGRTFWHDRSLGPAPWEDPTKDGIFEKAKKVAGGQMLFRSAMAWGGPGAPTNGA